MVIVVDSKSGMVMDVITDDEEVVKLRGKNESEFGMPDWDYD